MILCVNPNAAIDKTVVVSRFHVNAIQRPETVMALPGGKGCNVARALKSLGESPVVAGWVGGYAGQFIEAGLASEGIATRLVHTEGESRTCLSILDPEAHTLTELYEKGDPVPAAQVGELLDWFQREVGRFSLVTLSGSLPPGVPLDFYAQLIRMANTAHVRTLLDSSGQALQFGILARPTLVKPNWVELQELVGKNLESIEDCARAAMATSKQHATMVVVSLGAAGAIGTRGEQLIHARPPNVNVASTVGSGDSLLAGVAMGIAQSRSFADTLKLGVAAGTANAMTMGAGVLRINDFENVLLGTVSSSDSLV